MDENQNVRGILVPAGKGVRCSSLVRQLTAVALLCIATAAYADQLLVTGANRDGNQIYDLAIAPSITTPTTPVISSSAALIYSDAASHGSFDALVWVQNPVCNSLDLIVADAGRGQILRYAGTSTVNNSAAACNYNGTSAVSQTALPLFTWSKRSPGPAQPNGLSVDASGNVFVVSSSGASDPEPSVWVLPFNQSLNEYCKPAAVGTYCAPVLVDNKFCGTHTEFLAETVVAGTAAVTGTKVKTVLWNAGDLLVLVGDSFDARLLAYPQSKLYYGPGSKTPGKLNLGALPINSPSTPIPWAKFLKELAAPFGMDLCPGSTTLCSNPSVLFTTIDGRILSFDTVNNTFVTDVADRQGPGLQKIKVGSYANIPYAFVTQLEGNNTGQILAFGPPPSKGPAYNKPLATVSKITAPNSPGTTVRNPMGLAVAYTGSSSLPQVAQDASTSPCTPAPCVIAPLGPELVTTISAYPGDALSGTVTEQNCIVQSDPRVTVSGTTWKCNGTALPIGNNANTGICPSFPAAVIPGSVCGHSGPTGSGFVVIEGTAIGIDPYLNNSFITSAANVDAVLPGPNNLECTTFPITGQIPLTAWGTRSNLTTVEGTIAEDSTFGTVGAPFAGEPGYLAESTGGCDTSSSGSRELSIFAIGLALSNTSPTYVYALQDEQYQALEQTVSTANINSAVQNNLSTDIKSAETYVQEAKLAGPGTTAFTNDINCALNGIATTDSYVRGYLPAFSSNLETIEGVGVGNQNPAGDVDWRLAAWYTAINTMYAGNAPYPNWPLPPDSVPSCLTSTQPQITSFSSQPSGDSLNLVWNTVNANSCSLTTLYSNFQSGSAGIGGPNVLFNIDYPIGDPESGNSTSTPPYATPGWGTDTYTLTCYGAPDDSNNSYPATASIFNTSGFTASTSTPLAIATFVTDGYGNLAWTTANSNPNPLNPNSTTCTITDEFGGPPYYQSPIGSLPANNPLGSEGEGFPTGGPYPYFYNSAAFCPSQYESESPAVNTDTITLTCSDEYNGTAFSTLTLYSPGCFSGD